MIEYLTVAEVAERLRVSKQTVYRMFADGKLKGIKIGNLVRINKASLAELEDGSQSGQGESDPSLDRSPPVASTLTHPRFKGFKHLPPSLP